jgi:hypothetical protein
MVREEGLEPSQPFGHKALNLARLPSSATHARGETVRNRRPGFYPLGPGCQGGGVKLFCSCLGSRSEILKHEPRLREKAG